MPGRPRVARVARAVDRTPVRLAIDVGPLHGHRTGVGAAVRRARRRAGAPPDVDAASVRRSASGTPAASRRRAGCRCRPPSPHRLWARADWPRVDRWLGARPRSSTARTTSCRRAGCRASSRCTTAGSSPTRPATPAVRRAGERAAAGCGARCRASTLQHGDRRAGARRCSAPTGSTVVHLGPLAGPPPGAGERTPGPPALDGGPFVLAIGTIERRKNLPAARRRPSGGRRRRSTAPRSCSPAPPGDDSAAVDAAVDRPAAAVPRSRASRSGRSTSATKRGCCITHRSLAYPSLDEGFGFPILEAQRRGCRSSPPRAGSIPEVGRRRRRLVAARRSRTPSPARSSASSATTTAAASWSQPARATSPASRGRDRRRTGPAVPPRSRDGGVRMTVGRRRALRRRRRGPLPARARQVVEPAAGRGRRQHRRRHGAARPVDLARSRHDRLHARRSDRPERGLGPGRRDVAGDGGPRALRRRPPGRLERRADVVRPRRPRPGDPPVPHRPAGRGRPADRRRRRDRAGRGASTCGCCR